MDSVIGLFGVIFLVLGLVMAMFGYKVYKFFLFCDGFFFGVIIGAIIGNDANPLMLGLLLGILSGTLCVLFMRIGIFIMLFFRGFLMVMIPSVKGQIREMLTPDKLLEILLELITEGGAEIQIIDQDVIMPAILTGLVLGILGVIFMRVLIILSTGLYGGLMSGAGLCMVTGRFSIEMLLCVGIVISLIGIVLQFSTTKNNDKVKNLPHENTLQLTPERQAAAASQEGPAQRAEAVSAVDFRQKTAAVQAYTSQAIKDIKENGGKAAAVIRQTGKEGMASLRSRQKAALKQALSRKKDIAWTDLLVQIESRLYQSEMMAWILPFLEILTPIAAIVFIVLGVSRTGRVYGAFYGLEMGMPIFLAACLLSVIKRNRVMASGILSGAALVEIVLGIWSPVSLWFRIWLIALYMGLLIGYNRNFSGQRIWTLLGIPAKKMKALSGTAEKPSRRFCEKCGAELSENMKFCPKCGTKLYAEDKAEG